MNNKNTNVSKKSNNINQKKNVNVAKKNKKQDSQRIGFLLVAVVLFIVVLISTVFSDILQIVDNNRQTEELGQRYVQLLEEEASLSSEVTKLQDPDYVARYAREKYMYTKDGEKILTIIEKAPSGNEEIKEEE